MIKTEAENEAFLAIVAELMARPQLTPEEEVLLELLVRLIEEFEEEHYSIGPSTPHSRLVHLMEARELTAADLVPILGPIEVVQAIVAGQVAIGPEQAIVLGQFLGVDPALLDG